MEKYFGKKDIKINIFKNRKLFLLKKRNIIFVNNNEFF